MVALVLMLLWPVVAGAASFRVQAPHQVAVGDKFNVTFVLSNASGSDFSPPEVSGAQKIYGPARSTSYSAQIINGKSSSSSSEEYTMIYKATAAGTCHVGAASIVVGGKRLTTSPITIHVSASGSSSQQSQRRPSLTPPPTPGAPTQEADPMHQTAGKDVEGKDVFVRIELSKPRVYEQQAVVCTIKLYTKYQVSQFMPTLQPSFDGFLIEEIPMQPSLNNVETVNGQKYMVALLKKCILYPQQSGKLTITSGNYDVKVVQFDVYSTIFGSISQPVERSLKVKSNTATVNILPLPEPKPANFTGAVGHFGVTTQLTPATGLKTYSAATLSILVNGTGNIKYIGAPEVKLPDQFDVYDPKTNVTVNPGGGDMSGTVRIDYPFIPQFAGEFDIPASEFVYFDPETGKYETVNIPARHLQVAKGEGVPSNHYRLKNMDIKPIAEGDLHLSKTHSYMVEHWNYWLWYVIPLLAMLGVLIYHRKRLRERADVSGMRKKHASKVAQRRLRAASACVARSDRAGFYTEMLSALWGYMSDKLSIPVSELSKDNINAELDDYGVDAPLRDAAMALIDKCEFARYAPQLAEGDMNQVLDEAVRLIDQLENVKRKKQTAQ